MNHVRITSKHISLQVRNIVGKRVIVTRAMKTSIKRGKLSFETMDASIMVEEDGKEVALSKRCVDVNAQMTTEMGVSRAIINNVVFCHQEDSSWPLDEQKKLKEKFDAIFGTTEYNKAIDKVMVIKKAYTEKKTLKERDLKEYLMHKSDADRKEFDLREAQAKLEKLDATNAHLDEELAPIKGQLEEIRKIEINVSRWVEERTKLRTKLENCQEQQKNLKRKIRKLETDKSVDDLEFEIQCFKESVQVKQGNLKAKEVSLREQMKGEKELQTKVNEMKSRSGTLVYKRQQEQELLATRAKRVTKLCLKLSITVDSQLENMSVSLEPIFDQIVMQVAGEEDSVRDMAQRHDKQDEVYQTKIDQHRVSIAAIEAEVVAKREQVTRLKQEERKLSKEIQEIESSAKLLKTLSKELDTIDAQAKEFEATTDLEALQAELDEKKQSKSKLESQMEKLDDEIHFLTSIASLTSGIAMKQAQLDERESEVGRLRNKHQANLKSILGTTNPLSPTTPNYRRSVLAKQEACKAEKRTLADDLKRKQMKFAALQNSRKNQAENVKRVKAELVELEERVYDVCGADEYEAVLAKHKEGMDKCQLEFGAVKSSEALYKKYIADLKGHPGCPLCHTNMSTGDQTKLSIELQDEISALPTKIAKLEGQLKRERVTYDKVLGLRVSVDRQQKLKGEIEGEEAKLKTFDRNLKESQSEIEALEEQLSDPDAKLEIISNLIGDMQVLDEAILSVERCTKEISALKDRIPKRSSELTLDEAQEQKSTLLSEIKGLRSVIEGSEAFLAKSRKRFNALCEQRNQLKARQLKLQEGVQALSQLKERFDAVVSQIEVIASDIATNEKSLMPEKTKLDQVTKQKQQVRATNRRQLDEARQRLSRLKDMHGEIQGDTQTLDQFAEEKLEEAIVKMGQQLEQVNGKLKEQRLAMQEVNAAIEKMRKEFADQAVLERDLQDNLELKVREGEEQELNEKCSSLRKTIDEADYARVDKEKKDLVQRQDQITAKRGEVIGQQSELKVQVRRIEKELQESRYKDAVKNYRVACYGAEVLKQAISDLNQYKQALEWALLKYHSEHMERINELIREFWRDIYRGNDIDYIQIRTDEQASGDKRRSYNYRVVQCKNGTEIDMRGRCSAGQRVLASIIIRMALAETFSSNCGVLALDEPTTNLDKENIESLCMALRKILEARKTNSNFMLLVITHDEDFVQSLGNIDM